MKIPYPIGFIPSAEVEKAIKDERLLTIQLAMADECNLNCKYCYIEEKRTKNQMSLEEYQDVLSQSYELGARNLHLSFRGEPLLDKKTLPLVHYANKKGFFTLLITNGTLITEESAKELYPLNLSWLIKLNSLDSKVQDELAGVQGSSKKILNSLEILAKAGFTGRDNTRVGIDIIVLKEVLHEIPNITEYSIKKGLWPVIERLCVDGEALKNYDELRCSKQEEKELFEKLAKAFPGIESSYMGQSCNLWKYSISILNDGRVIECPMRIDKVEGNIKTNSIENIWKEHISTIRDKKYFESTEECSGKAYLRMKNRKI